VGGGPLAGEISKEEAKKRGWFEIAAGTGRERRSAPFNFELAERSAMVNGATELAVTKLDILYPVCKGATSYDQLPSEAQSFVSEIETRIGVPVVLIGTGPEPHDIIDRRN
jgi:adenylosuccinate synthase